MNGRGCRRKGHDFEREIAADLRSSFPEARRGLQYQDGAHVADVVNVPGWHIECKRHRRVNIKAALDQAIADVQARESADIPVAITKDDGGDVLVTMTYFDWRKMIGDKNENQG